MIQMKEFPLKEFLYKGNEGNQVPFCTLMLKIKATFHSLKSREWFLACNGYEVHHRLQMDSTTGMC